MKSPFYLKTFTFKPNGACYEYKYKTDSYLSLASALARAKKWIDKNYPKHFGRYVKIEHKGQYSKITIHFSYRNLDSNVHWGAYGKTFNRVITIEYWRG